MPNGGDPQGRAQEAQRLNLPAVADVFGQCRTQRLKSVPSPNPVTW